MMWVWAHEEPDHPPRRRVDDVQVAHPPPPTKTPLFSILRRFPASRTIKEAI